MTNAEKYHISKEDIKLIEMHEIDNYLEEKIRKSKKEFVFTFCKGKCMECQFFKRGRLCYFVWLEQKAEVEK